MSFKTLTDIFLGHPIHDHNHHQDHHYDVGHPQYTTPQPGPFLAVAYSLRLLEVLYKSLLYMYMFTILYLCLFSFDFYNNKKKRLFACSLHFLCIFFTYLHFLCIFICSNNHRVLEVQQYGVQCWPFSLQGFLNKNSTKLLIDIFFIQLPFETSLSIFYVRRNLWARIHGWTSLWSHAL